MNTLSGTRSTLLVLGTLALLSACAAPGSPPNSPGATSENAATDGEVQGSPSPSPTATPSPEATPTACEGESTDGSTCMEVSAKANIFGAGHDEPPAPAEGGAGVLPPMWEVPAGARTFQVTEAIGEVRAVREFEPNDAEGRGGLTSINSWEGISGILHDGRQMFLVGVFLTDDPPAEEAPARLDFTGNEDYGELAPEIGQTFYIGNGEGRTVLVPAGATRLFLGFADAFAFSGLPGWYGNNSGQLAVTVEFGE